MWKDEGHEHNEKMQDFPTVLCKPLFQLLYLYLKEPLLPSFSVFPTSTFCTAKTHMINLKMLFHSMKIVFTIAGAMVRGTLNQTHSHDGIKKKAP